MRDHEKSKEELIADLETLRAQLAQYTSPTNSVISSYDDGQFKTIIDDLPQMVYEIDLEGVLTYANNAALSIFGYAPTELSRKINIEQVVHKDDMPRAKSNLLHAISSREHVSDEYRARHKNGHTFPIRTQSQGIFRDGKPIGVRGTVFDLTDIRAAHDAVAKSEAHYRTLFENTGTAMIIFDKDGIITTCNVHFEHLSGYSKSEIEGIMQWSFFVDPDDLYRIQAYVLNQNANHAAIPIDYEFTFLARSGIRRFIHVFTQFMPGTQNRACSLVDITARKHAEQALRKSEERYQLVVRGANDGIWDWDLITNEVFFSSRYKEIIGYTDAELPNSLDTWTDNVHPDDIEHAMAVNKRCVDGLTEKFEVEYRMRHKDGSYRWIHGRGAHIKDENGTIYRMAGTHTDITDRKINERSTLAMYDISKAITTTNDLQHLYENIHTILGKVIDATNFYIGLHDKKNDKLIFTYFADENDDYIEIENISDTKTRSLTAHVIRTGQPLLITRNDLESQEVWKAVGQVGTPSAVWLGVPLKLRGNIIGAMAVQHYANPLHYSESDVQFLIAVSEQVALAIERKANEEALTLLNEELETKVAKRTVELQDKANELETANTRLKELDEIKSALVSSISHELRTPLTSIRGFAKLTAKDFMRHFHCKANQQVLIKKADRIQRNLNIIENEGERLTRLINDFLDINRIESGNAAWNDAVLNPCSVLRQAIDTVSGAFAHKTGVTLISNLPHEVSPIYADPDKIQQVLINLLNNAYKFTSSGQVRVSLKDSESLLTISVTDTGIGIPVSDQEHIFEKFHKSHSGDTVNPNDKGTGLGLAICREIVEHYGGSIWVDSSPGTGSTFSFTLPSVPGSADVCVPRTH